MKIYSICVISVWLFMVIGMVWTSVTQAGAAAEIRSKGVTNCSMLTIRIVEGRATFFEKLRVAIGTFLGGFMSFGLLIFSFVVGGVLFAGVSFFQWIL